MSVTPCFLHDDRVAIEQCEVCKRDLCGLCLWYADSGERLCPIHAEVWREKGHVVHEPGDYAQGIAFSEASALQPLKHRPPPYQGNSNDMLALLSMMMGLAAVLSCLNLQWFLPLLGFALGLAAWLNHTQSVDSKRTRLLAGIGITSSGGLILTVFGIITFCMMCYMLVLADDSQSGGSGPIITPTAFVIPTSTAIPTPTPAITSTPPPQ